jgi:hypothetical protein
MKSFLEGRPIVARNGSAVSRPDSQLPNFGRLAGDTMATAPLLGSAKAPSRDHTEKKVESVMVDGVVQKIIVTCGCGERIEVHCGY